MFQMLLKSNQWIQLLYLGTLRACEVIIFELTHLGGSGFK